MKLAPFRKIKVIAAQELTQRDFFCGQKFGRGFKMYALSDADKIGQHALTLRTQIRQLLAEFPKPKKFHVSEVAASTLVDHAYLSYAMLSMDAHPSITALRRHFQFELEDGVHYLTLDVVPKFTESERVHTVREACIALLGVCMYIDELLGGTAQRVALRAFFERFEASGNI